MGKDRFSVKKQPFYSFPFGRADLEWGTWKLVYLRRALRWVVLAEPPWRSVANNSATSLRQTLG
jgi:hypothetical protein